MIFQDWYVRFKKSGRTRYYVVGGIILFIVVADVIGYRWYAHRYNDRAQLALSQAVELLERAARGNAETLWKEAEGSFRDAYQRYPKSLVAPYLLSFWADTLLHGGDMVRALDLMNKAVGSLSKSSPFYHAMLVKRALMRMDAANAALVAEGKKELHELTQDKANKSRDEALYFEGLVAFDAGNRAEAQRVWQELFTAFGDSVWSKVAQAKLEYRI
ncbi:MAG: hypothetical protein M1549_01880 [Candidatus Dependentiae bacterium]|nr:hypothetical protein [Candidatus Dependentiae bacterium]